MAQVNVSPLLTALSGSIGSLTFFDNGYGQAVRTRVKPIDSFSELRVQMRLTMSAISSQGSLISDADRMTWYDEALKKWLSNSVGNRYKMHGQELFISRNFNLALCSLPLITSLPDAPAIPRFKAVTCVQPLAVSLPLSLSFIPSINVIPPTCYVIIQMSALSKPSLERLTTRFRIASIRPPNTGLHADLYSEWQQTWSQSYQSGKKIFINLKSINALTGEASTIIQRFWLLP